MDEYKIFFKNEKYNGMYHLATINKNKEMRSLGFYYPDDLIEKIKSLDIRTNVNFYICANMIKPFCSRKADNLFSLNNIVLDFDIHKNMSCYDRNNIIDDFVWRIKRDVFGLEIPQPNVIHRTGRGVQIWWNIEQASTELLFLYNTIIDYIVMIINNFLDDNEELKNAIEIDVNASKKAVGLFRMFNTYNTHTKTKTDVEILHKDSISLNVFKEIVTKNETVAKEIKRKEDYKKRLSKKTRKKATYKESNYTNLHKKRVAFIKYLAETRTDNVGERNEMLYIAFNSLMQYTDLETAKRECYEINNLFNEPLLKIEYIFKTKKIYKLKNKTFYEKLNITNEEIESFEKLYKKKTVNLTRNEEIAKNKKFMEEKKRQAKELLLERTYTQKEISKMVGLSTATVSKISKTVEKKDKQKIKPWESLGISKATYYRRKNQPQ